MLVLDTDHFSDWERDSAAGKRFRARLESARPEMALSIFHWIILPWDADAADLFLKLRRQGLRIGSLDLKIACIAFAHDATVLTRNTTDFAQVPGLRIENWLD